MLAQKSVGSMIAQQIFFYGTGLDPPNHFGLGRTENNGENSPLFTWIAKGDRRRRRKRRRRRGEADLAMALVVMVAEWQWFQMAVGRKMMVAAIFSFLCRGTCFFFFFLFLCFFFLFCSSFVLPHLFCFLSLFFILSSPFYLLVRGYL